MREPGARIHRAAVGVEGGRHLAVAVVAAVLRRQERRVGRGVHVADRQPAADVQHARRESGAARLADPGEQLADRLHARPHLITSQVEVEALEGDGALAVCELLQAVLQLLGAHAETARSAGHRPVAQQHARRAAGWSRAQAVFQVLQLLPRVDGNERALRDQQLVKGAGLGRAGGAEPAGVCAGLQCVGRLMEARHINADACLHRGMDERLGFVDLGAVENLVPHAVAAQHIGQLAGVVAQQVRPHQIQRRAVLLHQLVQYHWRFLHQLGHSLVQQGGQRGIGACQPPARQRMHGGVHCVGHARQARGLAMVMRSHRRSLRSPPWPKPPGPSGRLAPGCRIGTRWPSRRGPPRCAGWPGR